MCDNVNNFNYEKIKINETKPVTSFMQEIRFKFKLIITVSQCLLVSILHISCSRIKRVNRENQARCGQVF